ncbi:zinc ribbon domain-containing protein [Magnetococcus sp. PR-3]|uniref:zinc ribbon domain-containing protein n=1 Tax=Magnetococcus sp. PR-3 TaxID=3120355 RepID=UPI002FCE143A
MNPLYTLAPLVDLFFLIAWIAGTFMATSAASSKGMSGALWFALALLFSPLLALLAVAAHGSNQATQGKLLKHEYGYTDCPSCMRAIDSKAAYCGHCGRGIEQKQAAKPTTVPPPRAQDRPLKKAQPWRWPVG